MADEAFPSRHAADASAVDCCPGGCANATGPDALPDDGNCGAESAPDSDPCGAGAGAIVFCRCWFCACRLERVSLIGAVNADAGAGHCANAPP